MYAHILFIGCGYLYLFLILEHKIKSIRFTKLRDFIQFFWTCKLRISIFSCLHLEIFIWKGESVFLIFFSPISRPHIVLCYCSCSCFFLSPTILLFCVSIYGLIVFAVYIFIVVKLCFVWVASLFLEFDVISQYFSDFFILLQFRILRQFVGSYHLVGNRSLFCSYEWMYAGDCVVLIKFVGCFLL